MDNIALLILGVFISFLGIVNIMGNISTIHSYNRRRVKEEDVPKYGRAVGTGTLIIGVSLIAAFVTTFWSEKAMYFIHICRQILLCRFYPRSRRLLRHKRAKGQEYALPNKAGTKKIFGKGGL